MEREESHRRLSEGTKRERTGPATFLREVRGELRRVAWPSRGEVTSYSLVVLVVVTLFTLFVYGIDLAFGEVILRMFG